MHHLVIYLPLRQLGLNGERQKFNLANTLTARAGHLSGTRPAPENVDAARAALYKTANGGGRNPAADVL
jgi:hypothetical protein